MIKRIYKFHNRKSKYPDCPYDFDFIKGVEAIEAGEKAAEKVMKKIKSLL